MRADADSGTIVIEEWSSWGIEKHTRELRWQAGNRRLGELSRWEMRSLGQNDWRFFNEALNDDGMSEIDDSSGPGLWWRVETDLSIDYHWSMYPMPAEIELHRIFCDNVRHRRIELGLTHREVGERLGISPPSYTQIEVGRRVPTLGVVAAVAKALETSAISLLVPRQRNARTKKVVDRLLTAK